MKKLPIFVMSVMVLLASCATINQNPRPNYKIVDHKGLLAGVKVPTIIKDAMTESAENVSRKYFPDSYVFIANQKGRNLDGLIMWSKNFEVQAEVAKRIQSNINFAAQNSVSGDKDVIEQTMNITTELIAEQTFSGLQMQQDWWIKLQYDDEREEFQYVAIYSIKKALLDQFMEDAINQAAQQQQLDAQNIASLNEFQDDLSQSGYGLEESQGELSEFAFDPSVSDSE